MTDETPPAPDARRGGSGFYDPGTHDVAGDDDHAGHLEHCVWGSETHVMRLA
jgi:hypothetical protein